MTDVNKYKLNRTMLRISKDPHASLTFYERLGMRVIWTSKPPTLDAELYFLAFDSPTSIWHGKLLTDREGVIELNYIPGQKINPNDNATPSCFGYICILVDDVDLAYRSLAAVGGRLLGTPSGGSGMVLDPDGYPIKLYKCSQGLAAVLAEGHIMHSTMLSVRDGDRSLAFYRDVLGMGIQHTFQDRELGYSRHLLGYDLLGTRNGSEKSLICQAKRGGYLELICQRGKGDSDPPVYHNGNGEPFGYGHICVSVDDIGLACQRLEENGVVWLERLEEGQYQEAYVLDPDSYWIKIVQNDCYKLAGHDFAS
ncbi:hypothetical protein CKM354_001287800 [Cercospora kikuchii]|uniref:VOC domain-containing protein n=1 Tax=Cercospora kikuchii TaxID=84275 RepID=A0A9P3FN08_9PEZI|nr:uncharacterized protein CKM354_001287800 [Cercospora kikuchii]GIZ49860.1 hypothetical protein CKM354_001287800 [Cercospora kikuchii]